MRYLLALALLCPALFADSFINSLEYGEMLYSNPRGVGCGGCHGEYGEGKALGEYVKNRKTHKIVAPNISQATVAQLKKSFSRKNSVMPAYFLTDGEIEALLLYLKAKNKILAKADSQNK